TRGATVSALRTTSGRIACGTVLIAGGLWSPALCDLLGLHIPMQRVRAPAAETGPMPPGTIPGMLRGGTFGARQNRHRPVRLIGGYRMRGVLHDVSFADLRDLRVWAPALWQNRKDVALRFDPATLRAELKSAFARVRDRNGEVVVPRGYHPRSD